MTAHLEKNWRNMALFEGFRGEIHLSLKITWQHSCTWTKHEHGNKCGWKGKVLPDLNPTEMLWTDVTRAVHKWSEAMLRRRVAQSSSTVMRQTDKVIQKQFTSSYCCQRWTYKILAVISFASSCIESFYHVTVGDINGPENSLKCFHSSWWWGSKDLFQQVACVQVHVNNDYSVVLLVLDLWSDLSRRLIKTLMLLVILAVCHAYI